MEILKGWSNYLVNETNESVKAKAKFCEVCPERKHGKLLMFMSDILKEIEGHYCGICKCPLSTKLRSDDKCPLNKF